MSNENEEANGAAAAPESFRGMIESLLEDIHRRMCAIEAGAGGGDSAAGLLRTFDERIKQLETITAENTSSILRLSDLVTNLAAQVKALTPTP
jgi:cell division GTPase FtsZ